MKPNIGLRVVCRTVVNMPDIETFKRGQVEWALWRFATFLRDAGQEAPKAFRTRVKRLLEIDRADEIDDTGFAFAEAASGGRGNDAAFTAFDAFCLALALDLLDAGFKQSEIVFLMRHMRAGLSTEYDWIMVSPPPLRGRVLAKRAPDRPSYSEDGKRWADFRVFAVIQKVEMTEVFPVLSRRADPRDPVFLEPAFCRGIEALQKELNRMPHACRKALVLELSHAAVLVTEFLHESPMTKRGRA